MSDPDFLVITNLEIRMVVANQVKQEIQLDLYVLRDGGFFDFKTGMFMALNVDRFFVDVKLDSLMVSLQIARSDWMPWSLMQPRFTTQMTPATSYYF